MVLYLLLSTINVDKSVDYFCRISFFFSSFAYERSYSVDRLASKQPVEYLVLYLAMFSCTLK